jgi:hypothetical protein
VWRGGWRCSAISLPGPPLSSLVAGLGERSQKLFCHPHVTFCFHRSLDLTGPLLLGGVPDLPENFPVRMRHFVGCMRNLQVDSRHIDMADFIANNGTVPGTGAWGWGPGWELDAKEGPCLAWGHQPVLVWKSSAVTT